MDIPVDELWQYQCEVTRIVDPDTFDLRVDLGFGLILDHGNIMSRVRLAGLNVVDHDHEMMTKAGAFVAQWMSDAPHISWPFIVQTIKTKNYFPKHEKYGRLLAYLKYRDTNGPWLNELLVDQGLAVLW